MVTVSSFSFFSYFRQNISLIFCNISLSLFYIIGECDTDVECQKKFPGVNAHHLWCDNGNCVSYPK